MTLGRQETELLSCVSRLVRLLEEETKRLEAMRPKDVESLQKQKSELISEYQSRLQALAADRGTAGDAARAGALPAAARSELAAAAADLQEATKRNETALRAAKLATDQLVRSIAAAVLEEKRLRDHYRADGGSDAAGAAGKAVA
ncbi:MAG: hypothetical protein MI920_33210, partial [Kiloniellales bacterium]|nr:hypothetical protein [Kiloniellales bacterium]